MNVSRKPSNDERANEGPRESEIAASTDRATAANNEVGTLPFLQSFSTKTTENVSTRCGELSPGTRLAHYELVEMVGSGAFGTVWKARDTQLKRIVAMKIPHREILTDAEMTLFLREAQVAAQLHHPNIVAVHDVASENGTHFIVEDFVHGLPLDRFLNGKSLPARIAAEMCMRIASAVGEAHRHSITHRDLKPSNIIIDADSQPHLLDFGLAKIESLDRSLLTEQGQILGTPAYMSPEQARGDSQIADSRSDVYSLGVVFFEMLTGERPFRGTSLAMLKQTVEDPAPSPRTLDSKIPMDLETIALKCLEKSPVHRFQDAGQIEAELRRFLEGQPISIRSLGPVTRFVRWFIHNPDVSTITTGITFIVLGLLFTIWCLSGVVAVFIGIVGFDNPRAALLELLMAFLLVWLPLILTGSAILKQRRRALLLALILALLCLLLTLMGALGIVGREDLHGSLTARRPLYFLMASIFGLAVTLCSATLLSQRIRSRGAL